jgi:hypothetical protein
VVYIENLNITELRLVSPEPDIRFCDYYIKLTRMAARSTRDYQLKLGWRLETTGGT